MLFRRPAANLPEIAEACAVGTVTAHSVRFWLRVPGSARVTLELTTDDAPARRVRFSLPARPEADHTTALTYPDDFPGEAMLRPVTRYRFKLEKDGGPLIGKGGFDTFPTNVEETPARFSFAFASCHQPFTLRARPAPESVAMIAAANRALETHQAKFLILGGDQVYADAPPRLSLHGRNAEKSVLLEHSREDIRSAYQRQYRRSWAVPGFLDLGLHRATHCMLDDHEIVDNWGSNEAHASPRWQRVAAGALDAFFDYQGARNSISGGARPKHFHHAFSYGTIAVFVADVRSQRRVANDGGQVLGEHQIAALADFLRANRDKHCLFVHVGVPLIHVPTRLNELAHRLSSNGNDLHDRWSAPPFVGERDRLLSMLTAHQRQHPRQLLALLSGDIHAGWAAALRPANSPTFYQFVASALTNHSSSMAGVFARTVLEMTRPLERAVAGIEVRRVPGLPGNRNPYGGLNLGIVEVERNGATSSIRLLLIGQHPKERDQPVVIFDSGPLAHPSDAVVSPAANAPSDRAVAGG